VRGEASYARSGSVPRDASWLHREPKEGAKWRLSRAESRAKVARNRPEKSCSFGPSFKVEPKVTRERGEVTVPQSDRSLGRV